MVLVSCCKHDCTKDNRETDNSTPNTPKPTLYVKKIVEVITYCIMMCVVVYLLTI